MNVEILLSPSKRHSKTPWGDGNSKWLPFLFCVAPDRRIVNRYSSSTGVEAWRQRGLSVTACVHGMNTVWAGCEWEFWDEWQKSPDDYSSSSTERWNTEENRATWKSLGVFLGYLYQTMCKRRRWIMGGKKKIRQIFRKSLKIRRTNAAFSD